MDDLWRALMQKNGEATEKKEFYGKMWENTVLIGRRGGGLWTCRETLHVWRSYGNSWIYLGEYWCIPDWILSQNCRYALCLHNWSWLTGEEWKKNETIFHLFELGIRSFNKFYEIQTGGWPREILHVVKRRTIRKWELSNCGNFVNLRIKNFFVNQCRSKRYTMSKFYQKYIQWNAYNEYVIICRFFRRWCV